ncbi:MAG: helix-turn-helix domain-containing protein [Bacteroidales bacterium]|nr:helix-turn-helix domain-containing protein [Bacteroidales bacterium]
MNTVRLSAVIGILTSVILAASCQERHIADTMTAYENKVVSSDLSNQNITCFAEDSEGYIWIGTESGLNKYNGSEFVQYFHNEDSTSINTNRIKTLFLDSEGTLWIGTASGINTLDEHERFIHYDLPSSSKLLNGIYEHEDVLYATTLGCLMSYDKGKGSFEKVVDLHSSSTILNVSFFREEVVLFLNRYALVYNLNTWELIRQINFDTGFFLTAPDGEQGTFLASSTTVARYDGETGGIVKSPSSFTGIQELLTENDTPGTLLLSTSSGLLQLDWTNDTVLRIEGQESTSTGRAVSALFSDSNKNIWIGHQTQGYSVIYSYERNFYEGFYRLNRSLDGKNITSLTSDSRGRLWLVSDRNQLLLMEEGELKEIDLDTPFGRQMSGNITILNIYVGQDDHLWINYNYTLAECMYDGKALRLLHEQNFIATSGRLIVDDPVIQSFVMTGDKDGDIWAGWLNGRVYYKEKGQESFTAFETPEPNLTHMGDIGTMKDGGIICGFHARPLYIVDPIKKSISEEILIPEIIKDHIYITAVAEDDLGYIWVGTRGAGIFRVNPDHKSYSTMRDIPCRDVSDILTDRKGDVWISSYNGLFRYGINSHLVSTYRAKDGIGGQQFNYNASTILPGGEVIFGGNHGVSTLNPDDILHESMTIPFHFDELYVNNSLVKPSRGGIIERRLSLSPEIHLNHGQRNIMISYSALHYGRQDLIRYRYTFRKPSKEQWTNVGNNQHISLSRMSYGKHRLTVQATELSDPDTYQTIEIDIKVMRPFWFSTAAKLLYLSILMIIGIAISTLASRLYKSSLEKQALEKINEMDMRFFSNISHEFRTPLTMVNGAIRQLKEDPDSEERKRYYNIIGRNSDKMVRLVNQIMDFNKIEADVLKLSVSEADALACIRRTIEDCSFGIAQKHIRLEQRCDAASIPMLVDEDKLDKIVSNLLSNALKFTPSGEGFIGIDIDQIPGNEAKSIFPDLEETDTPYLMVRVFNSGSSIPEDKLDYIFGRYTQLEDGARLGGTGIGLYYTGQLIKFHHGRIKAENCEDSGYPDGTGVAFTFILPIDESLYSSEERQSAGNLDRYSWLENAPQPEAAKNEPQDGKPVILVIDDDYEVTYYLKSLLSPYYKVIVEQDGTTGYKAIGTLNPDLILCDVLMPGIDGIRLCRMVKDNMSICHIPFVLLTAKYTMEDQILGLDSRANAYVVKPFDPDYLLAIIKSQLQNRELMRQKLTHNTASEVATESMVNELDVKFVKSLYKLMEESLDKPDMNITDMSKALGVSRSQLFYKVKALTGETPHTFFNHYKLNIAAKWIIEGKYKLAAIAEDLGFSSASHFTALFKKEFGCLPSEYRAKNTP